MMNFIIKYTNILWGLPITEGDCSILGQDLVDVLTDVYNAVLIATPIIVLALSTVDIARAVIAQDDKDMKAASSKAVKRLIIGVAIMFVPLLLDAILKLAGLTTGVCTIGLK